MSLLTSATVVHNSSQVIKIRLTHTICPAFSGRRLLFLLKLPVAYKFKLCEVIADKFPESINCKTDRFMKAEIISSNVYITAPDAFSYLKKGKTYVLAGQGSRIPIQTNRFPSQQNGKSENMRYTRIKKRSYNSYRVFSLCFEVKHKLIT